MLYRVSDGLHIELAYANPNFRIMCISYTLFNRNYRNIKENNNRTNNTKIYTEICKNKFKKHGITNMDFAYVIMNRIVRKY